MNFFRLKLKLNFDLKLKTFTSRNGCIVFVMHNDVQNVEIFRRRFGIRRHRRLRDDETRFLATRDAMSRDDCDVLRDGGSGTQNDFFAVSALNRQPDGPGEFGVCDAGQCEVTHSADATTFALRDDCLRRVCW